jgi:hypothetical protein
MPIIKEGGQYKTVRGSADEESSILKELGSLTAEEIETLKLMLAELNTDLQGQPTIIDVLNNAQYKNTPVDLETFVYDPHFLGETCGNTYRVLFEDLKNVFSGGYNEVIVSGSIGYGKSYFASIGICRILYELSCMKSPQKAFGLAADSKISAICLSVTEQLAIKVAFEYIAAKIKASEYFQQHFPFKAMKKELVFPNNIWVAARATTDTSALGLAPIAAFLDETNFLAKPQKSVRNIPGVPRYDQAEVIYNAIKRRMKSRFEKRGRLPGILFLVSSKQSNDDFTERKIRESASDPSVYALDYALWDVKPEAYDMENCFHVFCGNEVALSRILEPEEVDSFRKQLPEGTEIIAVPPEFRADFERDLEGAIRDLAGRATAALHPFIHKREKIQDAIDPSRAHPFSTPVYDMSKGGSFLWSVMTGAFSERVSGGGTTRVVRPLVNPRAVRHVHIDPALSGDCAGFCMSHIAGWKDVIRRTEDQREYLERAPIYYVDVVLQIIPPIGGEIVLGDIRRLIYELTSHGYTITSVSTDSFQSADTIQKLSQKGYNAQLVSVDTSLEPYENLKLALYEDRVVLYDYEPLKVELRQLEKHATKNKVDHPPKGSKDCADALAGALFTLSQAHTNMPLPIVSSSSMSPMFWVDPGYAANQGNTSPLMPTPPSLGMADFTNAPSILPLAPSQGSMSDLMPPFISGGADWGSGWDPNSF